MNTNEKTELKVKISDNERDKIGEIQMMDVLDDDGNVLGKHAGLVLTPKIAADIKKYPDLSNLMKDIADNIHMIMFELVTREVPTTDNTELN